jgi:hypothetical protein
MLDQLDQPLRWYLAEARLLLGEQGPVLFCDESRGAMAFGTIGNRLAYLQRLEGAPIEERFTPPALRRAYAARNYQRGADPMAIQQIFGYWHIGTTIDMGSRPPRSSRRVCARDLRHAGRAFRAAGRRVQAIRTRRWATRRGVSRGLESYATSGGYLPTAVSMYTWEMSYSGDTNNTPAAAPYSETETVFPPPTSTIALSPSARTARTAGMSQACT